MGSNDCDNIEPIATIFLKIQSQGIRLMSNKNLGTFVECASFHRF